ncbi:MAG: hypothetical protein GXO64_00100 [Candidatus Micrarchaeota archaeon]|nr:hypothetical protein [Candidatus Micrarchaeota archaeon]
MENFDEIVMFIIFIIVGTFVVNSFAAEDIQYKTHKLQSNEQLTIIDDAKIIAKCLENKAGNGHLMYSDMLDDLLKKKNEIADACNIDMFKDIYISIATAKTQKSWEFGKKSKKKKSSYSFWTNIAITKPKKIANKVDFRLAEGVYKIIIKKIDVKSDVLAIIVENITRAETLTKFPIANKNAIKTIYEDMYKGNAAKRKIFILKVPAGSILAADDFIINGYEFRPYGKSCVCSIVPLWFEIKDVDMIDMGLVYAEK